MVDVIYGVIFPNLLTFWHALEFIICREIATQLLSLFANDAEVKVIFGF